MKFARGCDIIKYIAYFGGIFLQDYIYVIVAQTGTNVAKAIKFFTRKPYNHVSLSGDIGLSEMYSFCRNYPRTPLPATFNKEVIGEGTLGLYDNIPCEIYRINVTQEQKRDFYRIMEHFSTFRNAYSYNILGLIAIFLKISWTRKNRFLCSQFVAHTFYKLGLELNKSPCLYTPDDFRFLPNAELIYKGELNRWYFEESHVISEDSELIYH